jgi:hypothetical protein
MSGNTELQEAIIYSFCIGETSLFGVAKPVELKWNSVLKQKWQF